MQKSTGTRIDRLIEELKLSQLEFADSLGVTSGAVTNWKKRDLGVNVINKIVKAYPQVRYEWLVNGTGEMLNEESEDTLSRLRQLVELSGMTDADFAKKVNILPADFEKKLEGTMEVSDHDIIKISNALNIRIGWLMTGTGQMAIAPENMRQQAIIDSYRTPPAKDDANGIPLIPTNAMAGSLSGNDVQIMPYDIESYYVIPAFAKSDFCIRVEGNSMEPRYQRGDIIACKYVPMTDIFFQWGKVYVVATDQGVLVKHIKQGSDKEHVLLVSDNPDYDPFEISTSCIYSVAVINGLIRIE